MTNQVIPDALAAAREAQERGWPVHVNSGRDEAGRATLRYVIYTDWIPDRSRPDMPAE